MGGIIPARAGFTEGPPAAVPARRDHPRSRGVYLVALLRAAPQQRIIPARAGFTRPCAPAGSRCRDHPRSRGVYPPFIHTDLRNTGSSPLARGLPLQHRQVRHRPGIIPARAGFTSPPASPRAWSTDHPRSRGVYQGRSGGHQHMRGSSPLARGLRPRRPALLLAGRIIPVRAGFTRSGPPRGAPGGDHPRSRGVYGVPHGLVVVDGGSSPLARGLLDLWIRSHPRGSAKSVAGCLMFGVFGVLTGVRRGPAGTIGGV